jgi:uncharacterized membrane protein
MSRPPDTDEPLPVRWLAVAVAVVGALALLGVLAAWPRGEAPDLGVQPTTYVDAEVTDVENGTCPEIEVEALGDCRIVSVRLSSGDAAGTDASFQVLSTQFEVPDLDTGDDVVLLDVATSPEEFRYSFVDFQRRTPLVGLVLAFVVVVVAFGRLQGLRALAGLVASGVVLIAFVVPALLRDENALLVALSGTVVIAFVALYLAHGVNRATTVALAGTLVSLAVTTALAFTVAGAAHLTGLADSNAQVLRVTAGALDLRGLLIAGIVVGALGVLDDVTVSQVSTVAALRRADPAMPRRRLYGEAIRVGRDHVASTVNTLVLAYAGASLPLLLFFAQGDRPIGRLVTSELIAVEVVRMLVGSIGLVLAVPVTTALAAAALRPDDEAHAGHDHGQSHGLPTPAPAPAPPPGPGPTAPAEPAGWGAFAPEERRF